MNRHPLRVHEYNQTANGAPASIYTPPIVLAMMSDKAVQPQRQDYWGNMTRSFYTTVPGLDGGRGGIVITVKAISAQAATVSLCRFQGPTEDAAGVDDSCDDGRDNDW